MSSDKQKDEETAIEQCRIELRKLKEGKKDKEKAIRKKKAEIGRLQEDCVETKEDLECSEHPDSEFILVGNYSIFMAGVSEIEVRACKSCVEESLEKFGKKDVKLDELSYNDVEHLALSSENRLAYKCPNCGWVYDEPRQERFNTLGRAPMMGARGFKIYCTFCDK